MRIIRVSGARAIGCVLAALPIVVCGLACGQQEQASSSGFERARSRGAPPEREWRTYLGDPASTQSSPLEAIHAGNVSRLGVAWRYDARGAAEAGVSQIQFNPLVVKGVLYGISPTLRTFALDASTGAELWSYDPEISVEMWTASRGAVYWADGEDERLIVGAGPELIALDARTGRPVEEFGDGGRLDLRKGLGREVDDMMGVVASTPGSVFEDLLIVGGRVGESRGAAPGHIRAFDLRTGRQRWIFHTVPRPGEFGYESWPEDAWQHTGGVNAWAGLAVDAERGLVFVPTGAPTFDFFGGDRPGDNLFANSLLALDARTGERRWHYQIVRHDIWDRDLPAPPNLVEVERDGQRIPAVAQVTKTGDTFVFHRETGAPLFPIEERAVVGEPVPGEHAAQTQPVPSRPPPFTRQGFTLDLVTDRSEQAREEVLERARGMQYGALYVPPSLAGTVQYPGTDGGAEWGGAAWDAETGLLFVNANQIATVVQLLEASTDFDYFASPQGGYVMLCGGCHGLDLAGDGSRVPSLRGVGERLGLFETYRVIRDGRGHMPGFEGFTPWYGLAALAWYVANVETEERPSNWSRLTGPKEFVHAGYHSLLDGDRLPGTKPPWGTLTAIDLAAGQIRWQVPFGNYPAALEQGASGLGSENYGGPVVTAGGLLFIAATPDARLHAFDKHTGALLWEGDLPTGGFATPAVYEADGRQFVVVAAGGGKLGTSNGSEYVAFALPKQP